MIRRIVPILSGLWPAGLTWFAFRTWVALGIGFYAAFWLEIGNASTVGVCVLILAQPAQGMVLSKAAYRFAGTLVGAVVALTLTALFPQDRTMLLASFALFMGLQTALGSILRDFRSYGCILAGYTVAIISIVNIDNPDMVFASAVNRVAAIFVGIVAIALTNSVLASAESSRSLMSKLREATRDTVGLALRAIDERQAPDPSACVDMSARLMPLRGQISYAQPERAFGRARAKGGRSALLGLFELLSAAQAIGTGLANLETRSATIERAIDITRKALRVQNPGRCTAELEALALPAVEAGELTVDEAYVIDRMHFTIETMGNVRDGLLSLRTGTMPRRDVRLPVHQDWPAVVFNVIRVVTSCAIVSVLGVWSSQPATDEALLYTAVFVSLGAVQPDPSTMGKSALLGMPAVALAGAIYAFLVFPVINGFPLFIIAWLPLVVVMCWLIMRGMGGAGLIFGVQTMALVSPSNIESIVPPSFINSATMLTLSGASIFLTFLLVLPVDPRQRRLRLALAVGKALRAALADERRLAQPRASLQYDRLAQFKTWIGQAAPTPARHRTMTRLVDFGNLATVVRRAWRALDRARPTVDPALDAQARQALPQLLPERTLALSRAYIAASKEQRGRPALDLVHAAAALYGVALVTRKEAKLLRRVELLGREP